MIGLQNRQCAVVAKIDPGVGRFDKLHVHRQPLFQVLIGLPNGFEFLGDCKVTLCGRGLGKVHGPQGDSGLLIRGVVLEAIHNRCLVQRVIWVLLVRAELVDRGPVGDFQALAPSASMFDTVAGPCWGRTCVTGISALTPFGWLRPNQ